MDASYLVDGVAKGTLSLARHTVGGFADSAAMLAETFSKNMAVLTLDRKYAQKRDRDYELRDIDDLNVASGLGSGVQKLVNGFLEGVTGVVRAPIRGAEKHGFEGFAKGIGKGLLGLLVKPIIGISDGFTDVMIGVKGSVEGSSIVSQQIRQVRPRRALYGPEKAIRSFVYADAAASALMLRTSLAGDAYLSHLDLGDRVILVSCRRMIVLGRHGEELFLLRLKHIEKLELRGAQQEDSSIEWGVVIFLNTARRNGNEIEVIVCNDKLQAEQLLAQLEHGWKVSSNL
jgi:vacuolar protein sorting-associated protein 13A/C